MVNSRNRLRIVSAVWLLAVGAMLAVLWPSNAMAAGSDFTIQVTPSPLVVTLKPGVEQTATLTIRNQASHSETLIPRLNAFTMGADSSKIDLQTNAPAEIRDWVSFSQSSLTIPAGSTAQLTVVYDPPTTVGFSYAMAITLNRADETVPQTGAHYKASVAVFNLINIDRPGAKRQLAVSSFEVSKSHYEFLPANFDLKVKNTGNVVVQPTGTVFIQRSFDSNKPLATIPINKAGGYILPNSSRSLQTSWNGGFPHYVSVPNDDGTTTQHLSWDWKHVGDLRFGKYVAKVVLVYNDGQRDVPLVASVSFWVIPWRIIFFVLLLVAVLIAGIVGWGKIIAKGTGTLRKKYAARKK